MSNFVKRLKEYDDFFCVKGTDAVAIESAENQLGLHFAEEYKEYLSECGVASADGHEFTGIIDSARLNVVDVTERVRSKITDISPLLYVVEEMMIDGIAIWQSEDGTVYQSIGMNPPIKICSSLAEYLE